MQPAPLLSIGLAVRNGEEHIARCIDSVLTQDFRDLELVICDNASDDGTVAVIEGYSRTDPRISLTINDVNIGLHANVKRVLELSRGTYFRWISADDWLERGCLSACVHALESRRDAVGVTTWFTIHTEDGAERYEEYRGEFPTSDDPARRFERILWLFRRGDAIYDPVYGVYRREALMRAHPLRPSERADWLLSVELALMGPIVHIYERLGHRTRNYPVGVDQAMVRRRLDPVRGEQLKSSPFRLYRDLYALAVMADLTPEQLRRCRRALRRTWLDEVASAARRASADRVRRRQGFGRPQVEPPSRR